MEITKAIDEYKDQYIPGAMAGAMEVVGGIQDSAIVYHGAAGCHTMMQHLRTGHISTGMYIPTYPSIPYESELIIGARDKLMAALRRAASSKARPKVIWVVTNDATSMIGEDISGAAVQFEKELAEDSYRTAREAQNSQGVKCIALDTAGFLGGISWGAEQCYNAILDHFVTKHDGKREGINIVGPYLMGSKNWPRDIVEIKRLLEGAGVKVNVTLTYKNTYDELGKFGKARDNYMLCSEEMPGFDARCQVLGLRNWGRDLVLPIGMHNTEEWMLAVAKEFGDVNMAKEQMKREWAEVREQLRLEYNASWVLNAVSGRHAAVYGTATFAAAVARFLFFDLNMRPTVIALKSETPAALQAAEKLLQPLEGFLDFEVMENPTYWAFAKKIVDKGVDICVGERDEKMLTEGFDIPHASLGGPFFFNQMNFVPWPFVGIRGVLNLMSIIWEATNKDFNEPGQWSGLAFGRDQLRMEGATTGHQPGSGCHSGRLRQHGRSDK